MAKKKIEFPDNYNENYTKQDCKDVVAIIAWMNASTNRSNRWLSKCVGCSDAYISTLLSGKHAVPASELLSKILPVMDDAEREKSPGEFVETSIFTIVRNACQIAQDQAGFSIVSGSPGVGKSRSLEQYQKQNPNSIYLLGGEAVNSTMVIDMLIRKLGIKTLTKMPKAVKIDAIVEALTGTRRLIILDETDKCHSDTPDPLRTISDRAGVGVVLAGNVNLVNLVKGTDFKSQLSRYDLIEDRVVFWGKTFHKISPADADLLMRTFIDEAQIHPSETYDQVTQYAWDVVKGSARKLVKGLINNLLNIDEYSRKSNSNYRGISREMMHKVAESNMGISHPPTIPRRESAV